MGPGVRAPRPVGLSRGSAPGWCLPCSPNAEEGRSAEGPAAEEAGSPGRPAAKSQPGHRSYNLHERRRIGSMTGAEQAQYQKMPTDESEAQTLASADLDYMKSEWALGEGGWGAWSRAAHLKAGLGPGRAGHRLWAQGMPGAGDGQEQRQWHTARGWHPGQLEQEAAAMPPPGALQLAAPGLPKLLLP